jgi:chemotaxis-related protein WspB
MLFLLFQLGPDRYALDTRRVVEVVPLLDFKELPNAPKGVAGLFNYRGQPVPAVDLSLLTLGRPALRLLSTRIVVMALPDEYGRDHLLGLVAEQATEVIRKQDQDFVEIGVKVGAAPYLGPVLMDSGRPIQWIHEQRLLSESLRNLLFSHPAELTDAGQ